MGFYLELVPVHVRCQIVRELQRHRRRLDVMRDEAGKGVVRVDSRDHPPQGTAQIERLRLRVSPHLDQHAGPVLVGVLCHAADTRHAHHPGLPLRRHPRAGIHATSTEEREHARHNIRGTVNLHQVLPASRARCNTLSLDCFRRAASVSGNTPETTRGGFEQPRLPVPRVGLIHVSASTPGPADAAIRSPDARTIARTSDPASIRPIPFSSSFTLTRLATDQPSARSRFTTTPRCVVRAKWGLWSHTPTSPTVFHSRSLNTTRSLGRGRGPSIGANTCTPRMIGSRFASNGSDSPAWPRGATP